MTRLIDADALLKDIEKYHVSEGKFQHWIEVQNTVDAVPVIRCKDCKLYYPIENHKHGHCALYNFTHTDDDDYCSSAEGKEK